VPAIFEWLKIRSANRAELNDREATLENKRVIRSKHFLEQLYRDFYQRFARGIPGGLMGKTVVELGSGGGFLEELVPHVVTSDVLELPEVDYCFSGLDMPFEDASVDAFVMLNVFHHIPDVVPFLDELQRCLHVGGRVVMIEPANTLWARTIYRTFHDEPFDPQGAWGFPNSDRPLSDANIALPWIVFRRDRDRFDRDHPGLRVVTIEQHTPFRYLLSGGLTLRQLVPSFVFGPVSQFERLLTPLSGWLGMFQTIVLERTAFDPLTDRFESRRGRST
jgi:SAM-dependent methyltransferase